MLRNGSEIFGQAKVPNLGVQTRVEEDIRTLDVAVSHLPISTVSDEGHVKRSEARLAFSCA